MKLAHLLENRLDLLKLQQRLIDDLPDEHEVDLTWAKGHDCVQVTYKTHHDKRVGSATVRYLRPNIDNDPKRVLRATPDGMWSDFPLDGVISMLKLS